MLFLTLFQLYRIDKCSCQCFPGLHFASTTQNIYSKLPAAFLYKRCQNLSAFTLRPPKKPWFLRVCSTSLLKTLWEKEKLLVMSNFSFSHSVCYRFEELSAIFIKVKIVVCELFQFGTV